MDSLIFILIFTILQHQVNACNITPTSLNTHDSQFDIEYLFKFEANQYGFIKNNLSVGAILAIIRLKSTTQNAELVLNSNEPNRIIRIETLNISNENQIYLIKLNSTSMNANDVKYQIDLKSNNLVVDSKWLHLKLLNEEIQIKNAVRVDDFYYIQEIMYFYDDTVYRHVGLLDVRLSDMDFVRYLRFKFLNFNRSDLEINGKSGDLYTTIQTKQELNVNISVYDEKNLLKPVVLEFRLRFLPRQVDLNLNWFDVDSNQTYFMVKNELLSVDCVSVNGASFRNGVLYALKTDQIEFFRFKCYNNQQSVNVRLNLNGNNQQIIFKNPRVNGHVYKIYIDDVLQRGNQILLTRFEVISNEYVRFRLKFIENQQNIQVRIDEFSGNLYLIEKTGVNSRFTVEIEAYSATYSVFQNCSFEVEHRQVNDYLRQNEFTQMQTQNWVFDLKKTYSNPVRINYCLLNGIKLKKIDLNFTNTSQLAVYRNQNDQAITTQINLNCHFVNELNSNTYFNLQTHIDTNSVSLTSLDRIYYTIKPTCQNGNCVYKLNPYVDFELDELNQIYTNQTALFYYETPTGTNVQIDELSGVLRFRSNLIHDNLIRINFYILYLNQNNVEFNYKNYSVQLKINTNRHIDNCIDPFTGQIFTFNIQTTGKLIEFNCDLDVYLRSFQNIFEINEKNELILKKTQEYPSFYALHVSACDLNDCKMVKIFVKFVKDQQSQTMVCENLNQFMCENLFQFNQTTKEIEMDRRLANSLNVKAYRHNGVTVQIEFNQKVEVLHKPKLVSTFGIVNIDDVATTTTTTTQQNFYLNVTADEQVYGIDEVKNLETNSSVIGLDWSFTRSSKTLSLFDLNSFETNQIYEFTLSSINDSFYFLKYSLNVQDVIEIKHSMSLYENSIKSSSNEIVIDLSQLYTDLTEQYYKCVYFIEEIVNHNGRNLREYFQINRKYGFVRLINNDVEQQFDRELFGSTVLLTARKFLVSKNTMKIVKIITYKIELEILDVNDNEPKFDSYHVNLTVYKSSAVLSKSATSLDIYELKAKDADSSGNHVYTIDYGLEPQLPFEIDSQTGVLRYLISSNLDFDEQNVYSFDVIVQDGDFRVKCRFDVSAINDMPNHDESFNFKVERLDLRSDSIVGYLDKSLRNLTILNDDGLFDINTNNEIVNRFDIKLNEEKTFAIKIELKNERVLSYFNVFIHFKHEDNVFYTNFNETFVSGLNAGVSYVILKQSDDGVCSISNVQNVLKCVFNGDYGEYVVRLSESGKILNYKFKKIENKTASGFNGRIYSSPGGGQRMVKKTVNLRENTQIGELVVDLSEYANDGHARFLLGNTSEGWSFFSLNEYNGRVMLKRELNVNAKRQMRLSVHVIDFKDGKFFSNAIVDVYFEVRQENFEKPLFPYASYRFDLNANQIAAGDADYVVLGHVNAYTSDGSITYYLQTSTADETYFQIDSQNGQLKIARAKLQLLYESRKFYFKFNVIAQLITATVQILTNTVVCEIVLEPRVRTLLGDLRIVKFLNETIKVGQRIFNLNEVLFGKSDLRNDYLALDDKPMEIFVDSFNGDVILASSLTTPARSVFNFVVLLNNSTRIQVSLAHCVNCLRFTRDIYDLDLSGNDLNRAVVQFNAVYSSQTNENVRYRLLNGTNVKCLSLNAISGNLELTCGLSGFKEIYEGYAVLNVIAEDLNDPSQTATTLLRIHFPSDSSVDSMTNQQKPQFKQIYSTHLYENQPIDTFVLQVELKSRPSITTSFYFYNTKTAKLSSQSETGEFKINPQTGHIYVNKNIDRELNDSFVLKVYAVSEQWQIQTDISVYIDDLNDNRPVFCLQFQNDSQPLDLTLNLHDIESNDQAFVKLFNLPAADADAGRNGQVFYTLQSTSSDLFYINATNGDLFMRNDDKSQLNVNHGLVVTAYDKGLPTLKSKPFRININLVNENAGYKTLQVRQSCGLDMKRYLKNAFAHFTLNDSDGYLSYNRTTGILSVGRNHRLILGSIYKLNFQLFSTDNAFSQNYYIEIVSDEEVTRKMAAQTVNITQNTKLNTILYEFDQNFGNLKILNTPTPFKIENSNLILASRLNAVRYNLVISFNFDKRIELTVNVMDYFEFFMDTSVLYGKSNGNFVGFIDYTKSDGLDIVEAKVDNDEFSVNFNETEACLELYRVAGDGLNGSIDLEVELRMRLSDMDTFKTAKTSVKLVNRIFEQSDDDIKCINGVDVTKLELRNGYELIAFRNNRILDRALVMKPKNASIFRQKYFKFDLTLNGSNVFESKFVLNLTAIVSTSKPVEFKLENFENFFYINGNRGLYLYNNQINPINVTFYLSLNGCVNATAICEAVVLCVEVKYRHDLRNLPKQVIHLNKSKIQPNVPIYKLRNVQERDYSNYGIVQPDGGYVCFNKSYGFLYICSQKYLNINRNLDFTMTFGNEVKIRFEIVIRNTQMTQATNKTIDIYTTTDDSIGSLYKILTLQNTKCSIRDGSDVPFATDGNSCDLVYQHRANLKNLNLKLRLWPSDGSQQKPFHLLNLQLNRLLKSKRKFNCYLPSAPTTGTRLVIKTGLNHLANIDTVDNCVVSKDWFVNSYEFHKLNYLVYRNLYVNDQLRLYFAFRATDLKRSKILFFMKFDQKHGLLFCELHTNGYIECQNGVNVVRLDFERVQVNQVYLFEMQLANRQLRFNLNKWNEVNGLNKTVQFDVVNSNMDLYFGGLDSIDLISDLYDNRRVLETFSSDGLILSKSIYFNEYDLYEHYKANNELVVFDSGSYKKCPNEQWALNCELNSIALKLNSDQVKHVLTVQLNENYANYLDILKALNFNREPLEFTLSFKLTVFINDVNYDRNTNVTILKSQNTELYVSFDDSININLQHNGLVLLTIKEKIQTFNTNINLDYELKQTSNQLLILNRNTHTHQSISINSIIDLFYSSELKVYLTDIRQIFIVFNELYINNQAIPLYNALTNEYTTNLIDKNILITNYYDNTKPFLLVNTTSTQTGSARNGQEKWLYTVILLSCGLVVFVSLLVIILFIYKKQKTSDTVNATTTTHQCASNSTYNSNNSLLCKQNASVKSLSTSTLCSTIKSSSTTATATTKSVHYTHDNNNEQNFLNLCSINNLSEFLFLNLDSPFEQFKNVFDDLCALDMSEHSSSSSYVYYHKTEVLQQARSPCQLNEHSFTNVQTYV